MQQQLQLSQETIANLHAQTDIFNKTILLELQGQVLEWKHKASKVDVANIRLATYDTIFNEHTLLKLEEIV